MKKNIELLAAGLCGFSAVALGAFGAHGLKTILSDSALETFRTGVLYHLVHSVALLVLAIAGQGKFTSVFNFLLAGILLFSFSLYVYSAFAIKFFAMITPLGGISFLIGWSLLIYKSLKGK